MSRLTDIIDAAEGDEVSTQSLLRKVKVLAARMDTVPLVDWVDRELGGYSDGDEIPAYRGPYAVEVMSEWSGPMGWGAKNIALPPSRLPQGLRDAGAFEVRFLQSVSELQRIAALTGRIGAPWGADMIARINGEIARGDIAPLFPMAGMVSAYQQLSPALVESVLDSVRNRILSFALDLERVAPHAGEPDAPPVDSATVTPMVINNIYGDGNAVTVGGDVTVSVPTGDLDALLAAARNSGLTEEQLSELRAAVEADQESDGQPGPRVREWLGKFTWEGAKTAGKIGIGASGSLVAQLVRSYAGF